VKIPAPYERRRARIEIIPLIDIMFFLLATFVMVSLSMTKNMALPVKLPGAVSAEKKEDEQHVSITVNADGDFFFNKEKIGKQALHDRLMALTTVDKDPKVYVSGDGKTSYENVIAVLDEARKLGISKVSLMTSPQAK
jgi:biopolymer transport protein ExbD